MAVNALPNTRKRSERPVPRPLERHAGRALSVVADPAERTASRPTHLEALESEAVHVMREVVATFERPVLLFSGGKDSIVLLRLAEKAFRPARFPFALLHVDTGENFPEALDFRDRRVSELGERLIVASVQDSIDQGRVVEETGSTRVTQPPADNDTVGRDRRAPLRCGDRRRTPR
jgi:3'-phosphoadenosine 5'-phosphosulfate sulfotransferase (PAPS reductase)/FAD synthetase